MTDLQAADKQFALHYNIEAHRKEAQMQEILSKQYEIQELWNQLGEPQAWGSMA